MSEEIRKKMLVDYDQCLINDDDSTKPITNFIIHNASCSNNNNNLSSISNNFKNTIYSIVQIDSNKSMKKEYIPNSTFKVYDMLNKTILNNSSNNNINIDAAPKIKFKNKYKNLINTFRK